MRIIAASIDLSKIDKSRIVDGKNGAKYYDLNIIVNDEKNQYDQDVSISAGQTKDERTAKVPKVFIGNGKTVYVKEPDNNSTQQNSQNNSSSSSDLPF